MAKGTDTNIAVLVQVMDEMGFDQETIGKVTGVPLRTINDIANRRGCWAYTAEFNELRESCRLHLRKFILDDAMALSLMVMKRFEELIVGVDIPTAVTINNVMMRVMSMMENGR
ncbi:MAG: hypothetical protein ABIP88_09945 [Candidatus Binatia bacterium]